MSVSRYLILLAAIVATGCGGGGPEIGAVSGIVTLDGKPLEKASILFTPQEGGRASAAVSDAEGNYLLKYTQDTEGALVGQHIVTVTTGGEYYDDEGNEHEREELVPDFYNNSRAYLLTVDPGSNELNLELDSSKSSDASSSGDGGGSMDGFEE